MKLRNQSNFTNSGTRVPDYKKTDNNFIPNLNNSYSMYLKGKIDSILLRGDTIFAIVERDHSDIVDPETNETIQHGDGLFNNYANWHGGASTLAELAIPTNLDPNTTDINRYVGRSVMVFVQNGIALSAEAYNAPTPLTDIPSRLFLKIREQLKEGEDIYDESAVKLWNSFGVTKEFIEGLKDLVYRQEDMSGKRITFEGEGYWGADTDKVRDGEIRIKPGILVRGLNKLGMKTNPCHEPTRMFSAK